MKRFLLSAALLAAATTTIQAHTLDGIVKDNKTGEPLIGTVIRVKELPRLQLRQRIAGKQLQCGRYAHLSEVSQETAPHRC